MRRLCLVLILVSAVIVGSVRASAMASSARPTVELSQAAITNGPCLAPSPSYCAFFRQYVSGTFEITRFRAAGGQLLADGFASGTFSDPITAFGTFVDEPLTLPVTGITATCSSAQLTLRGSNPPDPANEVWEPLPEVLSFSYPYSEGTATVSVGLLPATVTASPSSASALCRLAAVTKSGSASGIANVLNSLLGS